MSEGPDPASGAATGFAQWERRSEAMSAPTSGCPDEAGAEAAGQLQQVATSVQSRPPVRGRRACSRSPGGSPMLQSSRARPSPRRGATDRPRPPY